MIIPITIHGLDASGQSFKENTWTIGVNKQGAKIATFHPLALGTQISIVNPILGRTAKGRVIWVGEKRFPEDPYEVGVELTEAQNVWGIKFPPEDWQKSGPVGPSAHGYERAAETAHTAPGVKPHAPEASKTLEDSKAASASAATPAESASHPEKFNQFNLAMTAISHFAQQAERTPETRLQPIEESSAKLPRQVDSQAQSVLQEVETRLDELEEKEKNIRSLGEHVNALADRLQASCAQVEALLAKVEDFQQGWQTDAEKARRNVQEAGQQALQSTIEELGQKLRKEMEAASFTLVREASKQIKSEASASVEAAREEAEAHLPKLTEETLSKIFAELEARQKQAAAQVKEHSGLVMLTARAEMNTELRGIADEIEKSFRGKMQKSLEDSAAQLLGRLTKAFEEQAQTAEGSFQEKLRRAEEKIQEGISGASAKVRETLDQEAEGARKIISNRLDWAVDSLNIATESAANKLQIAYQKIESSFKADVENYPKKLEDLSSAAFQGLRQKTDALLDHLQIELQNARHELQERGTKQFSEQLQKTADELRESSAKALHKHAQDVLEMVTDQIKAPGMQLVDATQKQLSAMAVATLEFLTKEAQTLAEEYRGRVHRTLQEFQDSGPRELAAQLQNAWEKHRESLLKQLAKEVADSTQRAAAQIKYKTEQAAKEACESVYKQIGMGAIVLRDWTDQARTGLDASLQKSVEAFQKQISDLSRITAEHHRKESEGLLGDLHVRLQQAALLFQSKRTEPVDTKTQEGPAKLFEPSSTQLRNKPDDSLDFVIDRLKEKQEQAVSDAGEAFRKKLSEILSGFQARSEEDPERKP